MSSPRLVYFRESEGNMNLGKGKLVIQVYKGVQSACRGLLVRRESTMAGGSRGLKIHALSGSTEISTPLHSFNNLYVHIISNNKIREDVDEVSLLR